MQPGHAWRNCVLDEAPELAAEPNARRGNKDAAVPAADAENPAYAAITSRDRKSISVPAAEWYCACVARSL